jgi:hypothetical protein
MARQRRAAASFYYLLGRDGPRRTGPIVENGAARPNAALSPTAAEVEITGKTGRRRKPLVAFRASGHQQFAKRTTRSRRNDESGRWTIHGRRHINANAERSRRWRRSRSNWRPLGSPNPGWCRLGIRTPTSCDSDFKTERKGRTNDSLLRCPSRLRSTRSYSLRIMVALVDTRLTRHTSSGSSSRAETMP